MERCQSGRMGHPAKVLTVKTVRGFESLPLRIKTTLGWFCIKVDTKG